MRPGKFPLSNYPLSNLAITAAFAICVLMPIYTLAQDIQPSAKTPKPDMTQTKLPRVITNIEVRGKIDEAYDPGTATLGGFQQLPMSEIPSSGLVLTHSALEDQQVRILTDATKNDASIGEDYAPVGYYPTFQIRGFPVDLATGLKINGLTIAGEQLVPLENKERVEFLRGLAGAEAGVASSGGLINFVTKRPAVIRSLELATDQRGTAYGHLDLGGFFGSKKQIGLRTNLGAESIRTYVNSADGSREFATFAGDWKINSKTSFKGDFEYQHQVQRSVSPYQLLGGTTVPTGVYPSTMLGEQSWVKPNTFDAFNTSIRIERTFTKKWYGYVAAGKSRSLINDNVAFAYGCYYETACNTGAAQPWFFSANGDYDVYDYRSPGELRINDQFEAILQGQHQTGPFTHNLVAGTSLLGRSVALPDSVYDYVGTDNIYQPLKAFNPSPLSPGPRTLRENSHQYAVVLEDRVDLPGRISVTVGGQIDTLHDHNYSQTDPVTYENVLQITNKTLWLPKYSVTYKPTQKLMVYGNYGAALSLGLQAPFWVLNSSQFLGPFFTRQAEVGAKYEAHNRLLLSADIFRMRSPFFYTKEVNGGLEFVGEGHETHRGAEISAQGMVASWLHLVASVAAIEAISDETGTPAFDGRQVINQPRVRTSLSADIEVPRVPGFAILPGWSYTGRKAAVRDDSVSVGGYNLFNLGLRYTPHGGNSRLTFRLYADNITNKRYWKDTGANYGDTFLHLGAPATIRASTRWAF